MILNYITRKVNLQYDEDGKLARKGTINKRMLERLNNLQYYLLPHPKSIGYEWFLDEVVPIVEETDDSIENLLHSSIHHICDKIAQEIDLNTIGDKQSLLVTGGGALNTFFIETLQQKLVNLFILLAIWFVVSFGAGILFKDALDAVKIGGFKLGFWFAQQGSIYVFVILIFVYVRLMNKLDKKYGYNE